MNPIEVLPEIAIGKVLSENIAFVSLQSRILYVNGIECVKKRSSYWHP